MSESLSPAPGEMTLRRLLHDVSPADFLSGYWGTRPLLVRRGQPLFYQHLLSLAEIDTLLYAGRLRPGEYRLSQSGEGVDLQFRGRDEMNKAPPVTEFYRAFEQGQAIVIHGLHKRLPAMAVVTRELERALACPVTTNAYLSPPDGQAYPKHYDTHDFFIFQLHGTNTRIRWAPSMSAMMCTKAHMNQPMMPLTFMNFRSPTALFMPITAIVPMSK